MRRLFAIALPGLLAAGLLAACGGDDDDDGANLSAQDQPTTESDAAMQDEGSMDMDDGTEMDHDEDAAPTVPGAREVEVVATSFEFDPPEIQAEVGEDLAIVLTSDDIEHDFVIDELGTHISADPGETAEGGVRADEPGTYTFYCSVEGHRDQGMEGTLVVS